MNALTLACNAGSPLMLVAWIFHNLPALVLGGLAVTVAAAAMLR